MANVTDYQNRELARLARAANRRLERASVGQKSLLDYYLRNYHTRQGAHGRVFQQGKAKTEAEYRQRMTELENFLEGRSTTRTGWKEIREETVKSLGETLRAEPKGEEKKTVYDLTDEELSQIMKELEGKHASSANFYKALNNVQAAKDIKRIAEGKDAFTGLSNKEIIEAVNRRNTEQEAAAELARIREAK